MGEPAATRPISGSASCAMPGSGSENWLLRDSLRERKRVALEPDAARGAADQLDDALACQRLQMFFGRVGGLEAEFGGDLGTRGRRAGARDGALDQVQNLLLAGGKLDGELACWLLTAALAEYPVPVFLTSF